MSIPYQGLYQQDIAGYLLAWQNAQAQAAASRGNLNNQYGFDASGHPDYHNTTGLYQQLQRNEGQQVVGAENNIRSRGFNSTEGFGAHLMQPLRYGINVNDNNFAQDYLGKVSNIDQGLSSASLTYNQGLTDARARAINRAIKARRFSKPQPIQWR